MKKISILFLSSLIMILITGCWDRRELNQLAIASAMGFDKKGKEYIISVQVLNPGQIATQAKGVGNQSPVTTYTVTAETIFEAWRKLTKVAPRKVYFSHLRMVIFGEKLAEEGIMKTLDVLARDHELRTDFYLLVTKGVPAGKILDILTPLEKVPARYLFTSLETSEKSWAATGKVTLDELMSDLIAKGKEPVLTGIKISGDPKRGETPDNIFHIGPAAFMKYSGMAIMKKGKLTAWLTEEESMGVNLVIERGKNLIVTVPCQRGGKMSVEIIQYQTERSITLQKGRPEIRVAIRGEGNVAEVACRKVKLLSEKEIREIEKKVGEKMEDSIRLALKKAKKYEADIFGFGEDYRRKNPSAWKKEKEQWGAIFARLPIRIKAEIKIRRLGTNIESIMQKGAR